MSDDVLEILANMFEPGTRVRDKDSKSLGITIVSYWGDGYYEVKIEHLWEDATDEVVVMHYSELEKVDV